MERYYLLIVTNSLHSFMNANSEIAYRVAHYLNDHYNCRIMVLGYDYSGNSKPIKLQDDFTVVPIDSIGKLSAIQQRYTNRFFRLLSIFAHPDCWRYFLIQKFCSCEYRLSVEYARMIRKLLRANQIDCIIGFSYPVEIPKALSYVDTNVPYIVYKLDPWSSHYTLKNRDDEKQDEHLAEEKAAAIITTRLIRKDYPPDTDPSILKKIHVLEFPNIVEIQPGTDAGTFLKGEKIHCVFAGSLYPDIRNPVFTIRLFERLKDDSIVFHLFSMQDYDKFLPCKPPENVLFHGAVDSDTARSVMCAADILVNIGNTIPNQMPSKILTYISLGLPILNVVKISDCPTLSYLQKYPLALNIEETQEPSEEAVEQTRSFILKNRGKRIPFETIKRLYSSCTLEYVGSQVYNIVCSAVEEAGKE